MEEQTVQEVLEEMLLVGLVEASEGEMGESMTLILQHQKLQKEAQELQ